MITRASLPFPSIKKMLEKEESAIAASAYLCSLESAAAVPIVKGPIEDREFDATMNRPPAEFSHTEIAVVSRELSWPLESGSLVTSCVAVKGWGTRSRISLVATLLNQFISWLGWIATSDQNVVPVIAKSSFRSPSSWLTVANCPKPPTGGAKAVNLPAPSPSQTDAV